MNLIFTNPLFLGFSVFALVPLIIHLLYKRKITVVKFSSLMFIEKAQKENSKRIKLREILLLILRTLLILSLVFAISRPVFAPKGTDPKTLKSASGGKSIIFIIDNSLSMGLTENAISLVDEAVLKAENIMSSIFTPGDAIAVLPTVPFGSVYSYREFHSIEDARMELRSIKPSFTSGSIMEPLRIAELFSSSVDKRIFIFSDFQRSVFSNLNFNLPFTYQPPVLINLSSKGRFNAVISSIKIPAVFHGLKSKEAVVSVKNTGDLTGTLTVEMFDNERKTGQKILEVPAYSTVDVTLPWNPKLSGITFGRVVLDGDQLKLDNTKCFVQQSPEKLNLLIVDDENFSSFIIKAFSASLQKDFFKVKKIRFSELASELSTTFPDVIIIVYIKSFFSYSAESLRRYVANGGSVFICLEKNQNIDDFNRIFFPDILNFRVFSLATTTTDLAFSVRLMDFSHPLLSYFQKYDLFKFVKFYGYFKVSADQADPSFLVLSKMNTDHPLLIEYKREENKQKTGKIVFFTSSLSDSLNSMPYSMNYLPFLYQTVLYLSYKTFPVFYSGVHRETVKSFLKSKEDKILRVYPKDLSVSEEDPLITYGVWKIKDDFFVIETPPEESEIESLNEKELKRIFKTHEIIKKGDQINNRIKQINEGKILSFWFILIALLCVAGEMIICISLQKD